MQQWYQCPNCGAPIAFGARFCGSCGTQLNWPTQWQQPPQYQTPQQPPPIYQAQQQMGLLGYKSKSSIEGFCRQFYDSQIFNPIVGGINLTENYYETVFKTIAEVDHSFVRVDRTLFCREMTALRLELFCFAWGQKFKKDELAIPQIVFTKRYLEQTGRGNIWDDMAKYNHVIARSATLTASGEQVGGRIGRGWVADVNKMRMDLFSKWVDTGVDPQCVAHRGNHVGADIKRADCIAVKLLAANLAERLRCDVNLTTEATLRLGAVTYGFYNGALEALKNVRL
ncbi:MAG: zinc ribbon domain-containing protein [Chloroflexi bacterium]|nr:zinc ribbon domain-containing protein [Chloroflexota bacterium]